VFRHLQQYHSWLSTTHLAYVGLTDQPSGSLFYAWLTCFLCLLTLSLAEASQKSGLVGRVLFLRASYPPFSSMCAPVHTSLLTELYPHRHLADSYSDHVTGLRWVPWVPGVFNHHPAGVYCRPGRWKLWHW